MNITDPKTPGLIPSPVHIVLCKRGFAQVCAVGQKRAFFAFYPSGNAEADVDAVCTRLNKFNRDKTYRYGYLPLTLKIVAVPA